ncbi:MAG TPA: glycosyltransferase family 39 protein [Vicinamibacteria bacterium]
MIVAATFRDYGITWDEEAQRAYGSRLLRWIATLGRDDAAGRVGNLVYYGGLFEIPAELAARLTPQSPYETRHLVNALVGLGTFWVAQRIGGLLGGPLAALLSAAALALTPVFYGHMFNNPKDVPFAALSSLAVWAMLAAWDALPRLDWRRVALVGGAIGAALAVRVAGLALLGDLALLLGGWLVVHRRESGLAAHLRSLAGSFLKVTAVAWVIMVASWPWALRSPLKRPLDAAIALARLTDSAPMLFNGRIVYSGDLPRAYVPVWFAVSLPEHYLIALGAGVLALAASRRLRAADPGRAADAVKMAWLISVAALPAILAVVLRPFLYDGIRHLLFVLPPLATLAGISAARFFHSSLSRWVKLPVAMLLALSAAATARDMVRLHPYESIYFNRLVGGGVAAASRKFETDYWGNSYKEGAQWLVDNYNYGSAEPVRVASTYVPLQCTYYLYKTPLGRARFVYVSLDESPHVVLSTTRKGIHERFRGRILHVVQREGAVLLVVIETRRPGPEAPGDRAKRMG